MAKKVRNEIAVGIIFSIVLVLTIYLVVMLANWSSLFTAKQKVTVRLPYKVGLKGLTKGSVVNLGGVKVGTVTRTEVKKIAPTSTDSNDVYVFFTMEIPQQYRLRTDCVLLPQSNILGGQAVLSIEDLGQQGDIINSGQTVDLLLADSVMDALKREFDPDDPESFFAGLIKNVSGIIERIQEITVKVNTAMDTTQVAIEDVKELIEDERIDAIINNVTEISTNLKLTTQEVRRAPWKLLYKPKRKEYKIQALIDSAGAFATGAERLDNTAMRLNKLVTDSDSKSQFDIDKIESMVSELETCFNQFQKAEKKFWDELK